MLFAALAALVVSQAPSSPPAHPPAAHSDDSDVVPVAVTVSGGISAGDYQAGLQWTLMRFFKAFAVDAPERDKGIKRFRIDALTGASAGNVNAFLATIDLLEKGDGLASTPRKNVYWTMWGNVNIDRLFPFDTDKKAYAALFPDHTGPFIDGDDLFDNHDDGIFTRRAFSEAKNVLLTHVHGVAPPPGFDPAKNGLPVGVTLTELLRQDVHLGDGDGANALPVQVMRRTVPLIAYADGDGVAFAQRATWFAPEQPFSLRSGLRLRASATTPNAAGNCAAFAQSEPRPKDVYATVGAQDLFSVVEASSAFPLAFAPKKVNIVDAHCGDISRTFVDGGVVDNNPLSLAEELVDAERHGDKDVVQYIYIDQDNRRPAHAPPPAPPPRAGLDTLIKLASEFVDTGRQAELYALFRMRDAVHRTTTHGDSTIDSVHAPYLVTTRGSPTVSSMINHFAGFLGRPFRETDFDIGVYDGIYFLARTLCADRKGDAAWVRNDDFIEKHGGSPDVCAASMMPTLFDELEIDATGATRAVFAELYAKELAPLTLDRISIPQHINTPMQQAAPAPAKAGAGVLRTASTERTGAETPVATATQWAQAAQCQTDAACRTELGVLRALSATDGREADKATGDVIHDGLRTAVLGYFGNFIDVLRDDAVFTAAVADRRAAWEQEGHPLEAGFNDMLKDVDGWTRTRLTSILERQRDIENDQNPQAETAIELGQFVLQTDTSRFTTGLNMSSSLRLQDGVWALVPQLLDYDVLHHKYELRWEPTFTWVPCASFGSLSAIVSPGVGFSDQLFTQLQKGTLDGSAGGDVVYRGHNFIFSGVFLGARAVTTTGTIGNGLAFPWSVRGDAEGGVEFLAGKLRLSAVLTFADSASSKLPLEKSWRIVAGIGDLSGLVYWLGYRQLPDAPAQKASTVGLP